MRHTTLFLAATLLSAPALAFQPGDTVPASILNQLNAHPDKITVVDFFAEWCESCRKELPLISALKARSDASQVHFAGVDTDEEESVALAFQQEMKASGGLNFMVVNDLDQSLVGQFRPKGFPALYIIKDGKVVSRHLGATANIDTVIETDLQKLLTP